MIPIFRAAVESWRLWSAALLLSMLSCFACPLEQSGLYASFGASCLLCFWGLIRSE